MKKFNILFSALIAASVILISCSKKPTKNLVKVTARDYYFFMHDSIPSGWTTFRLVNEGHATHFFFLTLLPEGVAFENYINEVGPAFVAAWDTLKEGATRPVAGAVLGGKLPKWYASAKYMGGTGLIAIGDSTEVSIKLVPGNYVMECYIKTPEGKFHSELGMIRPVTVTNKVSGMKEPNNSDIAINLYNSILDVNGNVSAGKHTVAVHFNEQPDAGLGNDVHLVRLKENTDLDKVIQWMDWMNIDGLRTPAPAEFLGGSQEMPAGYTSYFNVNLTPGRYAWISESGANKGMVKEFTIE